jgi:hypothetical protein
MPGRRGSLYHLCLAQAHANWTHSTAIFRPLYADMSAPCQNPSSYNQGMVSLDCYNYVLSVFTFTFLLLCWVGVYYGIYKISYDISNILCLNSCPPSFSFNPFSSHSWNSFNSYHFFHLHTCAHRVCTIRTLSCLFFPFLPTPKIPGPQARPVLPSCSPLYI